MSLMQMSIYGSVLIAVILVVRLLWLDKLPKRTFPVLWGIVLLRLLIPFSVSSSCSFYSFLDAGRWQISADYGITTGEGTGAGGVAPAWNLPGSPVPEVPGERALSLPGDGCGWILSLIWGVGCSLCSAYFAVTYLRSMRRFREAVPVEDTRVKQWLQCFLRAVPAEDTRIKQWLQRLRRAVPAEDTRIKQWLQRLRRAVPVEDTRIRQWLQCLYRAMPVKNAQRKGVLQRFRRTVPTEDAQAGLRLHGAGRCISVKQTDHIAAPLTYGIIHPVILLPGKIQWKDSQELAYVLQHEYVHICRRDALRKLLAAAALCVHWFNPLVWIMAGMLNRDIELACDEEVLRRFGSQARVGYAMALIGMEEKKRSLLPIFNGFSRNAIEERINLIMKYKKMKYMAAIASGILVLSVTLAFATTAKTADAGESQMQTASVNGRNSVNSDAISRDSASPGNDESPAAMAVSRNSAFPGKAGSDNPDPAEPGNSSSIAEKQTLGDSVNNSSSGVSPGQTSPVNSNPDNKSSGKTNLWDSTSDDKTLTGTNSADGSYVISYMAEGLPREEPADLYRGSGYCILVPKEGWRLYAPDAWLWEDNDLVQFWVADFGGSSLKQVTETYTADGYALTQEDTLLQKESDDRLFFVRLRQDGARIMSLTYTYPAEPEYIEGFGSCLEAISMNFSILPAEGGQALSEDALQAKQLALDFWEAWLTADEAGMKACLSNQYSELIEGFPTEEGYHAREAEIREIKGLNFGQMAPDDSCTISIEFLPSADADSLVYLTLELVKEAEGLKIYSYGLEM